MNTIDSLLGPRDEASFVHTRIGELMIQDRLPADTAARIVRQRIDAGDPLMLAHEGQEWTIRSGWWIGPWGPGDTLRVIRRLTQPATVVLQHPEAIDASDIEVEIPLLAAAAYLTGWRWTS